MTEAKLRNLPPIRGGGTFSANEYIGTKDMR